MRFKLFSRRLAEQNGEIKDVYEYDPIPTAFRNQFYHILKETVSGYSEKSFLFEAIESTFAAEKGLKHIDESNTNPENAVFAFLDAASTEDYIDLIDLIMYALWNVYHNQPYSSIAEPAEKAIDETNYRFKFNSLGYEFVNGEIIRIDNQVLHLEVVKPALVLISDGRFSGANEEMRKAYEFRRTGDNKNAIIEACKAFESTMKSICSIKSYGYDPTAPAKLLLAALKSNQYFPNYLDTHMDGLRITLESGLPTVRNKNAGHGQGEEVVSVPDAYVDYALHLLATNIVFLVKLLNP